MISWKEEGGIFDFRFLILDFRVGMSAGGDDYTVKVSNGFLKTRGDIRMY
jgi:hypothetical protein